MKTRLLGSAALGFFLLCLAWTLWPLQHVYRGVDFRWIYAAGETWLAGHSPYEIAEWAKRFPYRDGNFAIHSSEAPFVYPPHWALFAVPLATLPYPLAIRTWDLLNVSAHLGTLWLTWLLLGGPSKPVEYRAVGWLLAGLATLTGSARFALWEPQMSVVPTLGIVGAFWALQRNKFGLLIGFVFLASLKPQLSALPLAFLVFNGGHKGVIVGGLLAIAVALAGLLPFGIVNFPDQFLESYRLHLASSFNVPSSFTHLGGLLSTATGHAWLLLLAPSMILAAWLVTRPGPRLKEQLTPVLALGLTCAAAPAFFPLHVYDLVLYTPVLMALASARFSWWTVATIMLAHAAAHADFLGLTDPALRLLPVIIVLVVASFALAVLPRKQGV